MPEDSVSTDPEAGGRTPDEPALRRRRRRAIGAVVSSLLVIVVIGSLVLPTPYFMFSPGRLRPTADRVDVTGAERFDSEGTIYFTTIRLDQATVADLVRGAIDDSIEIRTREEVAPGGDLQRSKEQNRVRMDVSKTLAQRVALDYLGYRVSDGVEVVQVVEGGPSVGRLRPGDLITALDSTPIDGERDLRTLLAERRPGEQVVVTVRPVLEPLDAPVGHESASGLAPGPDPERGEPTTVTIRLGEAPDPDRPGGTRAVMGILPITHEIEDLPIDVDIDSGEVGGPSAGLAFTLTVIDLLTDGDLTRDRSVAATGQINRDGTVGRIGGLVQKASAALRQGGVDVMLYPADTPAEEVQVVRRLTEGRIELHPVSTIDEAVEILNGASLRP